MIALERGKSGRIYRLKIVGSEKEIIIGKELEIRRVLSNSHLYSSAFIIEKSVDSNNIPTSFTLKGAGWGTWSRIVSDWSCSDGRARI